MIYLDTSVALAHLLGEGRRPPAALWSHNLASSRLIEYELWTRAHAYQLSETQLQAVRDLLARLALVSFAPAIWERATRPFPTPLRTLDALHLATIEHLRERAQPVELASYDERMLVAARALGIPIHDCG